MRLLIRAVISAAICCAPVVGGAAVDTRGKSGALPPAPSLTAVSLEANAGPVQIDGNFNEAVWTTAPAATEFLQREPSEGTPATHPTEVRVAYDATALYVAVRANEPEADRVKALLTRRDDDSPSDWIRVLIDSYHDRRTAFEFAVNAGGVKQDKYWFNDTNNDTGWDGVWDVAVARSPEGWRAEFKIPFSQLRYKPGASDTFGFAVARTVAHLNETSTWPLLAKSASGFVSSFGELTGLVLTGAQKKLELMPYAVAQVSTAPVAASNPLASSPDSSGAGGLDLKYQVGAGLTLTGTINPDFGQVEADPAVVNLNGFETFFSERRPFFVEGSGNFSFDMDCMDGSCTGLFYSRRIGRAPHRSADAPENGFAVQPTNTTILGAAKLTGRVGKFSVGALNAVTRAEHARLAFGPDLASRSTSPVEPASNYSILRMNREFTNQSRLGFIITSTNRFLPEELRSLPNSAVTGGVDGDWRLGGGKYSFKGNWAGSMVRGAATAIADLQQNYVHAFQRPDATHVAFDPNLTRLNGHTGGVSFGKITGRELHFNSSINYKSPGFESNDLGYLQRADDIFMINWAQLIRDVPTTHVRSFRLNFNQWSSWNFDHDRRVLGGNINAHWELTNNWGFGSGINMNGQGFDDRLTRGGPGGYVPGEVSQWGYLETDNRKLVAGGMFGFWSRNTAGSWSWGTGPSVALRPSPGIEARVGIDFNRNWNDAQWVEKVTAGSATHYVFGQLDQTTLGISMRLNYTLTPRVSLQLYGQPFVSAGGYTRFRELVDGRAAEYADRYAPFDYQGQPNFNYHSFRTTNVLRWEYRPGSVLFVVWQQGRDASGPQGDFQFARDFGRAFTTPGTNVFLVKISRWVNY